MGELHEQGKSISDIEGSLKTIPLYPETIRAIKFAFSVGCDLRILSDANLFFIKTILEAHDLLQYFTEIKTNPSSVDEDGRLRICPYHPFTVAPHGCNLCPPNMYKNLYHSSNVFNSLPWTWASKPPLTIRYTLEPSIFDTSGTHGSHCSTLERLLAWEKKLYQEVRSGEARKIEQEKKLAALQSQEIKGENVIR